MRSQKHEWQGIVRAIRQMQWSDQCETIRRMADDSSESTELALINLLDCPDPNVREVAMTTLAERSKTYGRIAARALLEDSNATVRNAAAGVLGYVGKRCDEGRLRLALLDHDWVVRSSAADSLGQIGAKTGRRALIDAMTHDVNEVVRRDAAYALSYAKDVSVIPDLETALECETAEQTRIGLLSALYSLGARAHFLELLALLRSHDDSVRHATVNSIAEVTYAIDRNEAARSLRELIEVETNPGLKEDAKGVLDQITPGRPNATYQALNIDSPNARANGKVAGEIDSGEARMPDNVAKLIDDLHSRESNVRWAAAVSLGVIGDARAVDALRAALKDASVHVRVNVAEALGKMGAPAIGALCIAFDDKSTSVPKNAAKALIRIGAPAVELLCKVLGEGSVHARQLAAIALGSIGDGRAITALCTARSDDNEYVRMNARDALQKFGDRDALVRTVLLNADMTMKSKEQSLNGLRSANYHLKSRWYGGPLSDASRYCDQMKSDADIRVRTAAEEMLRYLVGDTLVRSSELSGSELLIAASENTLLRSADAPNMPAKSLPPVMNRIRRRIKGRTNSDLR